MAALASSSNIKIPVRLLVWGGSAERAWRQVEVFAEDMGAEIEDNGRAIHSGLSH